MCVSVGAGKSELELNYDLRKLWKEKKKKNRGEKIIKEITIFKPEEKQIVRLKGYSKYSAWWKQAYQCIWKLQEEKQSLQRNENHIGIKYLISYLDNEEKSEFEPTHIQTTNQVWKQDKDLVPHARTQSISFQHSKNQEDTSYIRITWEV